MEECISEKLLLVFSVSEEQIQLICENPNIKKRLVKINYPPLKNYQQIFGQVVLQN